MGARDVADEEDGSVRGGGISGGADASRVSFSGVSDATLLSRPSRSACIFATFDWSDAIVAMRDAAAEADVSGAGIAVRNGAGGDGCSDGPASPSTARGAGGGVTGGAIVGAATGIGAEAEAAKHAPRDAPAPPRSRMALRAASFV